MKKFTKIISMICVLTFVLSLSVFADIAEDTYVEYSLKSDKASYNVGDDVTITLYTDDLTGSETFALVYVYYNYDSEGLEFVSDSTGLNKAGSIECEEAYVADWASAITWKFKATTAGSFNFALTDLPALADANGVPAMTESQPSITITVKEAGPVVRPTGLPTTYSLNGKTYTDVPNKEVTATATGSTEGVVTLTYWADGVADKTATVDFTTAAAALTGTGSVTFNVAVMGVPRTVVITDIAVAFK